MQGRNTARRPGACLLALGICAAIGAAQPGWAAAPARARAEQAQAYTFAFSNADISAVAEEILGKTLGVAYTIDPGVTGKMSFRIDQKLTRSQLFEAFESTLAANDVVVVRSGDALVVQPRAKAKTAPTLDAGGPRGRHAGYQTVAVPLSYATPSEVAKALAAVAPASAVVSTDDKTGMIILGGTDREIDALIQAVRVFDQSGLQSSRIRYFELSQAPAASVAAELDTMIRASGVSGIAVAPLKRLNGVYVFARTPQALDKVGDWIERLDTAPKANGLSMWVYHPRSVSADSLKNALSSLLFGDAGGASPASSSSKASALGVMDSAGPSSSTAPAGPAPALAHMDPAAADVSDSPVRLGVDKDSNTLLVSAPQAVSVQIQRILSEIDHPPSQILIEASVLEVTLTDDTKLGVDWNWLAGDGTHIRSITNPAGVVKPSFPGFSVTYLSSDIRAAVNTLGTKAQVEVVSAPKIMTLNNRPARLEVGDQVPLITQSAQGVTAPGSPVIDSVDYRSTGIILSVTPQITNGDEILLAVNQEVSSVSETTSSSINSPTIQQRKFDSTVVLKDGGTVALGGLISTKKGKGASGLPLVSSVPIVGALFGSQKFDNDRTELIVLLSATIVNDQKGADAAMANLLDDMHEVAARGLLKSPH